jgi:hypothetical protein
MNRRIFLAAGVAVMAMSHILAKDKPSLPVTAELKGEVKYVLDLGGKTQEEFEESLKPARNKLPKMPLPPKVDLKLVLKNTSDKDIQIYNTGDPVMIDLELSGPGAVTVQSGLAMTRDYKLPKAVKLEAGKTLEIPVTQLSGGMRGMSKFSYWTKAGEYDLKASFKTGLSPAPKDAKANSEGFAMISIESEKLKIEVKDKK